MCEPLVSIIMPAYNAEKYIKQAIVSVQKQRYENWELLICDDCSKDSTIDIVNEQIELDSRIKLFVLEKNSGAAVARNTSIKHATGNFIAFLDSDDTWEKEKLEIQIKFMEENDCVFSCTYYNKIDSTGAKLNKTVKYKKEADFNYLLKSCPGNSTVIYNTKELGKFYISNIKKRNDYLMWFSVIRKANILKCVPIVLSSHRINDQGLSNDKKSLVKYHWYIYRNELELSFVKSGYLCVYWIVTGLLRYFKK